MKKRRLAALLITVAVLLFITGCLPAQHQEAATKTQEGGDEMQQPMETFRVQGTQLDRRPQQTALATFALG